MSARNVVVTGAAGALGRAVCSQFAKSGYQVVAIDRVDPSLLPAEARHRLGGIDLSDQDQVERAYHQIKSEIGSVHALANVAGGFAWEKVEVGSVTTWDRLYALNLKTALNSCQAGLLVLSTGGAIVNVGAAGAARAAVGMGAYAASKAAVEKLTETLAAELKTKGIRVNAVLPSIIDTAANRMEMPEADHASWVTPQELAHVIEFLISDLASGITGAAIPVVGRV